ncbi:hypothetical protein B0H15DRAFT_309505 [Mycena belliarum]|uniref:ORC1/DEAH AAA+ ATPase domain-containing protein n=1 Tax=Mycena belliarum TaxID=1033014 RepID=A0AAD6U6I6_9AGAR|nr:hypothetical protein B0H15DRAFT_309505 [Mycena belliae]
MMSWLSRHRPGRRGAKKSRAQTPPPASKPSTVDGQVDCDGTSTALSPSPLEFRPNITRQDTDATLVDECNSDSETTYVDGDCKIPLMRCASPDSFDSLPIKKEKASFRAVKPNSDDPSLWKKSQETGTQYFGPVQLDCELPIKVHRSRFSKLASGTTHTISTILEASIVVGEASNIPYLKGLAGIILLVSNAVQATEDNEVDCIRLSKMVLDLANVASQYAEDQAGSRQLALGIQILNKAFTRILQALQANTKRSRLRRLIEASNERDLLRDCERELQHCLDVFQIRSHILTSVTLKRKDVADDAFENDVSDALLPVKNLLAEAAAVPAINGLDSEDSESFADLPPMPQILHGRDTEFSELVRMFAQPNQAHAVLMGQGGAGKSTLALALMHQAQIKDTFHHQRFLVKCQSANDASSVLSRLASALGLPHVPESIKLPGYREAVFTSLGCSQTPSLIVFDDLDDAWDLPATRLEVEDLLTELSIIPNVSLLITLRGTQRPLGPAYTKPYPAPLGPIAPTAARQIFFAISDVYEDSEDDPLVDVLLQLVGFLPMPVTLLAQLAQYEPLPFLIERYREEGTGMLCGGNVTMDDAIEASLHGPRVSEFPAALEVLRILARFPDGTPKAEVTALVVGGGRLPGAMVNKCLSVLHKTSLVVVVPRDEAASQPDRLKVPEVVRTYLERHVLDGHRFRSFKTYHEMRYSAK